MLIGQLSDMHIRPKGQLYHGVADSNRMLTQAIQHLHSLDRSPDLVLLTGDVVDEGHPDEYAAARELLADTAISSRPDWTGRSVPAFSPYTARLPKRQRHRRGEEVRDNSYGRTLAMTAAA